MKFVFDSNENLSGMEIGSKHTSWHKLTYMAKNTFSEEGNERTTAELLLERVPDI